MKKNWFFIVLLSIAALALAGTAAYFSVFGISKLFAAAGLGIVILASSLEFAKLVTVSYVYRFWKTIKKGFRGFYIFAVVFIMLLTSIGIYGFLTSAYQKSANKIEMRDSQIKIAENKKTVFVNQLDRVNKSIESSTNRINTISNVRDQQEKRLTNLYDQKYISSAKRTENQITGSDDQIRLLNQDITDKMKQANSVNDSIAFYDQKIVELKNSDVSNEVGPYKFISDLTGISMNRVVNIVAILIILVFDPLAIALLIGVNQLTMAGSKRPSEEYDGDVITEEKEDDEKLNKVKKFFKKSDEKIESFKSKFRIGKKRKKVEPEIIEPEVVETNKYDLFKSEKQKETPEVIQTEIPLTWDTKEEDEETETETVSQKKTLVGEDFSDFEDEKNYEERLEQLTHIESGTLIEHDIFGRGKILEVYPNNRIKVKFKSGEIKELNVDFANLKEVLRTEKDWFDKYTDENTDLKKKIDIEKSEPVSILEPEFIEPEIVPEPEQLIFEPEPETVTEPEPEIIEPEPESEPSLRDKPTIVKRMKERILEERRRKEEEDNGIQSLTFGNRIIMNPPEAPEGRKIHFTKDRKGRLL